VNEPFHFSVERVASRAANYLRRLPRKQQESIAEALDYLCNVSPFHHPNPTVIRQLKGKYRGHWRYRIGNIRIVYMVGGHGQTHYPHYCHR